MKMDDLTLTVRSFFSLKIHEARDLFDRYYRQSLFGVWSQFLQRLLDNLAQMLGALSGSTARIAYVIAAGRLQRDHGLCC